MDFPSERKVHQRPIPRIGGVVIFITFYLSFIPMLFYRTLVLDLLTQDYRIIYIVSGSFVAFGLGFWDDIKNLSPQIKLLIQTVAALIVCFGGLQIDHIVLPGVPDIYLGWLSIPVTVFWVLMVMNAVNLTDGLDGLASGFCFIMCAILFVMSIIGGNLYIAVVLAALSGAIFGFLKYNFNPASIFLGDGGSYFLGYMIATLSILGSIKTHAAVTVLIPLIAMGIPLMDTIWSALRRFIYGKSILKADRGHFHHKLLQLGYTPKRAVIILYGFTIFMGGTSLLLIFIRDDRASLLLLLLGAVIIIGIRRLGYMNSFSAAGFYDWFRDLSDEAGLRHDRRIFFNLQVKILIAKDINELWYSIIRTMKTLSLDYVSLKIITPFESEDPSGDSPALPNHRDQNGEGKTSIRTYGPGMNGQPMEFVWATDKKYMTENYTYHDLLKIELPLLDSKNTAIGKLILRKDLKHSQMSHYTLKRIEQFRRTLVKAMETLRDKNKERND